MLCLRFASVNFDDIQSSKRVDSTLVVNQKDDITPIKFVTLSSHVINERQR